jgi:peptidoglycan L-alanyl-D-glutamate endopeptidase CwlK
VSAYSFGSRSENNLVGVHPDLVKVVRRALALSEYDFAVIEGLRTKEKQTEYFKSGASKTLNSRHITGHAVDLYPSGKPTPWARCHNIKAAMFEAARELGVSIRWGGDWDMDGDYKDERFYDGPHFELLRSKYP